MEHKSHGRQKNVVSKGNRGEERDLARATLAQAREARVPHAKAHLSSQSARQQATSREATKVAPEVGSSKASGSAARDARQPGEEDRRSRWGQIRPSQRTLSHGQTASCETLEIPQTAKTCAQGLDTQARQSRETTTWHTNHDGTCEASPGEAGSRTSM